MNNEDAKIVERAMASAIYATASPHEWTWTAEDTLAMARGCCVLSRLLSEQEAEVERWRKLWLSPGQDEWPGKIMIGALNVAGTYLKASCGELGLAMGNILLHLASCAAVLLAAQGEPRTLPQGREAPLVRVGQGTSQRGYRPEDL